MGRAQVCSRSSQDRRAGSVTRRSTNSTPHATLMRRDANGFSLMRGLVRNAFGTAHPNGASTRVQVILARSPRGERYPVAPPFFDTHDLVRNPLHTCRDHASLPVRRPGWTRVTVNHQAAGSNPATGANSRARCAHASRHGPDKCEAVFGRDHAPRKGAIVYWLGYLTLNQVERDRYPLALPIAHVAKQDNAPDYGSGG